MSTLSLDLFGNSFVTVNGSEITFRTKKAQALLFYLATEEKEHRRDYLMELLWPGMPDGSARQNLRQTLFNLRKAIPEEVESKDANHTAVSLIQANRQTIQVNPLADIEVDVRRFKFFLHNGQVHNHVDLLTCHQCRQDLEKAAQLYKGDFLAEFYLEDSREFEEWTEAQRHTLRRKVLDALDTLTTIFIRQKNYAKARAYAEQQLEIDDLRESSYRQLMEILALEGQREEALAMYERCRVLLAEELGMAPTKRTTEMYEKIIAGDIRFDEQPTDGIRGYELKEEIGQGGYGTIYRAVQPTINRDVAVKVIRRKYANNPEFIRRFEAEAQTIARLEHPYIVPLHDYWRDPDGAYLVMRLFRGGNLLDSLKQGPWDSQQTLKMVEQIGSALAVAHRQGIVHRDIKPANILFDETGNAYLSDFGIAKDLNQDEHLTGTAQLVGTPDYISPEQLKNEQVTSQSDLYSLGAVLYETMTGERPFSDAPLALRIQKHLQESLPLVSASRPNLPQQIDDVIQKATAKRPSARYSDALAMVDAFRQAVRGQTATTVLTSQPVTIHADGEINNPYKGLRAFQERDAADFYGRERLTQQLISRFSENRFLAVVGPSGSGKSSLIKAGMIPALRQEAIPGAHKWFIADMVPGTHPLEELELALLPIAVNPPPSLLEPMQKDERGMLRTIRRILPDEEDATLLLFIDQFEELFTLVEDDKRRQHFLNSLLEALNAPRSPLRVVVTLRADFYDRPLQIQPLAQLFKENSEIILPLTQEELTWAIQEPARQTGVGIEPSVITAMVADVVEQPGALPLLQYALTELFEERQDHTMTLAAYDALGGVSGALALRAEELYASFEPAGQEATRQLFLRLVTLGEGVEDTRRRVRQSEVEGLKIAEGATDFASQTSAVLTAFGRYRLLTFDRDLTTREPTVEVAHEALLREWPRLRRWLEGSRENVRLQRLLAASAAEWITAEKDSGFLLRGSRLDLFADWSDRSNLALTQTEDSFLTASITARQQRRAEEQARQRRELEIAQQLAATERQRAEEQELSAQNLRRRAIYLGIALVIAAIWAIAAVYAGIQATNNAETAVINANTAATQESLAAARAEEALESAAAAATAESVAQENEIAAVTAQETAVAEGIRADEERNAALAAEAEADLQRGIAEQERDLTRSRELAGQAKLNQDSDPELSILLALEALSVAHTTEAETVLHEVIQSSRVRDRYIGPPGVFMGPIDISSDGKYLAAVGYEDHIGRVWDTETGEEIFTLEVPLVGSAFRIDFSPTNHQLATLGQSETFTLMFHDVSTGELVTQVDLPIPIEEVSYFTLSPDWNQLAVSFGNSLEVWDLVNDQLLLNLPISADEPTLAFNPGGQHLLTTANDEPARLWDIDSGQLLLELAHNTGWVTPIFSPNGNLLIFRNGTTNLEVWELNQSDDGELSANYLHTLVHGNAIFYLAFNSDGTQFASASRDQTVKVWDPLTGELLVELPHGTDNVAGVVFSPDNTQVYSGDWNGSIRIWDITFAGAAESPPLFIKQEAHDIALSRDGNLLATSHLNGVIALWNMHTGENLWSVEGHSDWVLDIDISPDATLIATASSDGTAKVWDAMSGEILLTFDKHGEGKVGGVFSGVLEVAFSPDSNYLATAGADKRARLWDLRSGEEVQVFSGHTGGLTNVVFSPDGTVLATSSDEPDVAVKFWNVATGEEMFSISADHADRIWGLNFSPDGQLLATSGGDATVKLWQLDFENGAGNLLATLTGHNGTTGGVIFSVDGRFLASRGGGELKLWDLSNLLAALEKGEATDSSLVPEIVSLTGHSGVVLSPDGKRMISALNNGTVQTYMLDVEELISLAHERSTRNWTPEECEKYRIESCPSQ